MLNFLVSDANIIGYYDLYLQIRSDVLSGQNCSNYQTIHLPSLFMLREEEEVEILTVGNLVT